MLEFRKFSKGDFADYVSWFDDAELCKRLGPAPNQEWLAHVLSDETGRQYSVFRGTELVSVVGIVLATEKHPFHTITDIATRPDLRGSGIGAEVVDQLTETVLSNSRTWAAFVEEGNQRALDFFKQRNWVVKNIPTDSDSMFELRYTTKPRQG